MISSLASRPISVPVAARIEMLASATCPSGVSGACPPQQRHHGLLHVGVADAIGAHHVGADGVGDALARHVAAQQAPGHGGDRHRPGDQAVLLARPIGLPAAHVIGDELEIDGGALRLLEVLGLLRADAALLGPELLEMVPADHGIAPTLIDRHVLVAGRGIEGIDQLAERRVAEGALLDQRVFLRPEVGDRELAFRAVERAVLLEELLLVELGHVVGDALQGAPVIALERIVVVLAVDRVLVLVDERNGERGGHVPQVGVAIVGGQRLGRNRATHAALVVDRHEVGVVVDVVVVGERAIVGRPVALDGGRLAGLRRSRRNSRPNARSRRSESARISLNVPPCA